MININSNVSSVLPNTNPNPIQTPKAGNGEAKKTDFADTIKAVGQYLSKVDDLQQTSNMSIQDLLSGKNEDITSVVSAMAKADMSFKLLVGVRNKLIEAYKRTMNMQV